MRPHLPAACIVVGLAACVAGLVLMAQAPRPQPDSGPQIPYVATWTLTDLVRHAGAGEVDLIDAGTDGDRPATSSEVGRARPALGARTMDGRWVRVELSQTPGEALVALRTLGFGGLMSTRALAALAPAPPTDPLPVALLLPAIALVIVGSLALAQRRSNGPSSPPWGGRWPGRSGDRSGDGSGMFRTTVPPSDRGAGPVPAARAAVGDDGPATPRVSFDDVAGCDEAKAELLEVVDFLRDPDRFTRLGARIPRGVLFYGPPGNGKTLLARAVAAQAGVPFTAASGSDFVEKFVGVGAQRVRDLFRQARAAGTGVIFIDEIDALARTRSAAGVNNQEADQTLNALLTEMDGFPSTETVIVLAATNRIDTLDPAVLRPGRFGRRVHIPQPDLEARRSILAVHARTKPIAPDVSLDTLARRTGGFSGAMLADLLNEAAILAARRDAVEIDAGDIEHGWTKVAVGVGRRRSMPLRERAIIAAHEAGHAICGRRHAKERTVERISMYRHGDALGYTLTSEGDELLPSEAQLRGQLVALMGGRAAEALLFVDTTGGASNDFSKANQLAEAMVTRWGLGADPVTAGGITGRGALGYLVAAEGATLRGEADAAATRAIAALLDQAYAAAVETLRADLDLLERVAAYLVEMEEMTGEEFAAICEGRLAPSPEALETWLVADARPRERRAILAGEITRTGASPWVVPAASGPATAPVRPVEMPADAAPRAAIAGAAAPTAAADRRRQARGVRSLLDPARDRIAAVVARPTSALLARRRRRPREDEVPAT